MVDGLARNLEIKARIANVEDIEPLATRLASSGPVEVTQDDTFFACANGRIKLRALSAISGQLIFYDRTDETGPKASYYDIVPTDSPDALRQVLERAYGQVGRVRKVRRLFHVGRTRIHLDRVEGLGDFLELEVVLASSEPVEAGVDEARRIMTQLGIEPEQLVAGAYVDLIAQQEHPR